MLSETTVTQIKEILLSGLQLNKIILFGSQARGTADDRSDVDLLVLTSNINDRYALMRELRGKLLPLKYAFDVIAITPEEFERDRDIPGTISRYASLEGEIIYET